MKNWVHYKNGNYIVSINILDGSKIRQNNLDYFEPDTVESIDVKITNKCGGTEVYNNNEIKSYSNLHCAFCHEGSSPFGKHGDILAPSFLDKLHPYCELAIGGGNPLQHPDLDAFLLKCKERRHIPNMTVNQRHFLYEFDRIKKMYQDRLIFGLGVSLVDVTDELIEKIKEIPTVVVHVINGLVTEEQLRRLKDNNLKVLILGYKEVRRGKKLYEKASPQIEERKEMLKKILPTIIKEHWFDVVSFDNLSLKQLEVKKLLSKSQWDRFYQGDDGLDGEQTSATFFVDLVERKFAKNSCASDSERYDLMNTAEDMLKFLMKK